VGTALAGNEFAAGDKVKIVNPVTGQFQTFTVASAPSAGATAISVNSATAAFDIPQNAGLFVQLTPQAGGGGVADGDKGDITVSSSGTVWTIDLGAITESKIGPSAVSSGKIAANAVINSRIRQSAALSVIGRSANSTGDVADIAAGTDGHVLRRSGTTLGFGQITRDGIVDSTITLAKLQNITSDRILGRFSSGSGAVEQMSGQQALSILQTNQFFLVTPIKAGSSTNLYSSGNFTFKAGCGTSPTLNSIVGNPNMIRLSITTGTSIPSGASDLFSITLDQNYKFSTLSTDWVVIVQKYSNFTNNIYVNNTQSDEFTIKTSTELTASTTYEFGFILLG
jgi:hypothetical protein